MFLAKKSPRIYVVFYQEFRYKSFIITETYYSKYILHTHPLIRRRLLMGQKSHCYMLYKKMRPYAVVCAHSLNPLPMQQFDDLCVTHQFQVTRHDLSYKAIFCSSATVTRETLHCSKRFAVVQE